MSDEKSLDPVLGAPPNTTTAQTIQQLHDSLLSRDPFYGPIDMDKPSPISAADLEMIMSKSKLMANKAVTIVAHTPNTDRDPFGQMYSKAMRFHANTVWLWGNPAEPTGSVTVHNTKLRPGGGTIEVKPPIDGEILSRFRK